ncbi:MAG: glycogen-binding domain-containing protein [Bacteroidota bacterium]
MPSRFGKNIERRFYLLILLVAGAWVSALAQGPEPSYRYEDGNVIIAFENIKDKDLLDRYLGTIGSSLSITDSLHRSGGKKKTSLEWELIKYNKRTIEYRKPIKKLASKGKKDFFFADWDDYDGMMPYELDVAYGVNRFNQTSVVVEQEDQVVFSLSDFPNASSVYLSGTFNNWSTLGMPMMNVDGAWVAALPLKAGKHLYKFIVDGSWITDPANGLKETDRDGHTNSVFYNYNYTFRLVGSPNAKEVFLAGSFNDWNPEELRMQKSGLSWELPMFLREGTHTYKFVVDGEWVLDPLNSIIVEDEKGHKNSKLTFGKPYIFEIDRFADAKEVILTGNFNNWQKRELYMAKEGDRWQFPVVLRPGNYEYKYIVDGREMCDPTNAHTIGSGKKQNSILAVRPNYTFKLDGYGSAKEVLLSGTFNDWSVDGYTMEKVGDAWQIKLHLPRGKVRYKFIVDGKWIRDPENEFWEYNQFDTKNSILWIN